MLLLVFSNTFRLIQPIYDVANSLAILAILFPNLFFQSIITFYKLCVQAPRRRVVACCGLLLVVEILHFLLTYTFIIVASRSPHQVHAISFIHSFGENFGVEHYGTQFVAQLLNGVIAIHRQLFHRHLLNCIAKESFREVGAYLVVGVMMVDTIREPNTFQVQSQLVVVFLVCPFIEFCVKCFQCFPYTKVVFSKLVCGNVPTA